MSFIVDFGFMLFKMEMSAQRRPNTEYTERIVYENDYKYYQNVFDISTLHTPHTCIIIIIENTIGHNKRVTHI